MNFLGRGFQKLELYRQTDRQTDIRLKTLPRVAINFRPSATAAAAAAADDDDGVGRLGCKFQDGVQFSGDNCRL